MTIALLVLVSVVVLAGLVLVFATVRGRQSPVVRGVTSAAEHRNVENVLLEAIGKRRVDGGSLVVVLARVPDMGAEGRPAVDRDRLLWLERVAEQDPTAVEAIAMDEHVVCLVTGPTDARAVADARGLVNRLRAQAAAGPGSDVTECVLQAGLAVAPSTDTTPAELVRLAAIALYDAHGGTGDGRGERPVGSPFGQERPRVIRLPEPMDRLEVAYQPKVAFATGDLVGAEALVRWPSADGRQVSALEIVGMARAEGRLQELTDVVMRQAAAQCARLRDAGFDVPISINLTEDDVADPHFPERLQTVLRTNELRRDSLVLEVTETALLTREAEALGILPELAALGTRVSVDDFGTGYSSLSHLRRFPVHEIKIDMSFVDRMVLEPLDAVIVRSIIEMGHGLGMDVVAEGVETADTWAVLAELGTDIAQGHHVMRATDPATFLAWARFRRHRHTPAGSSDQPRG